MGSKRAGTIMFQGTASHVGKSLITAAFCRILSNRGVRVAPFKSQNMALNSFVTTDGAEIGRAQAFQAEAARIEPSVDINPVLLKPTGDSTSQVIIHGKVFSQMSAVEYHAFKPKALSLVMESFERLASSFEAIVIEGAGSPAEINLREGDIVNMGLAEAIDAPVILIGDIDRGGVFASIVGTIELLSEAERERVKGIVINKFRGDIKLLEPGLKFLEDKVNIPVLGVVKHMETTYLPDEDGVALERGSCNSDRDDSKILVAIIRLPRISNFTDFDPLFCEAQVSVAYINGPEDFSIINNADLIILPGTKNTISDMEWLNSSGLTERIKDYVSMGGALFGICGGFQMLGRSIADPQGVEGSKGTTAGLGLLDMETTLKCEKDTFQIEATLANAGHAIEGYEIHMGETVSAEAPFSNIVSRNSKAVTRVDGAVSRDERVQGTYIHGIFDNDEWRRAFLANLKDDASSAPSVNFAELKEEAIERLAARISEDIDIEALFHIAGFSGLC